MSPCTFSQPYTYIHDFTSFQIIEHQNPYSLKAKEESCSDDDQSTCEIKYPALLCHHNPPITAEFIPAGETFPLSHFLTRHCVKFLLLRRELSWRVCGNG